jgi:hypothetical protein
MIDGDNKKDLWTIQSVANEKGRGETVIVKTPAGKLSRRTWTNRAVFKHCRVPSSLW